MVDFDAATDGEDEKRQRRHREERDTVRSGRVVVLGGGFLSVEGYDPSSVTEKT